jgi:hypothetical protein
VRFLISDFDGTLGYRVGRWSSALHSELEEAIPGHGFEKERLTAPAKRIPLARPGGSAPGVVLPRCVVGGTIARVNRSPHSRRPARPL